MVVRIEEGNIVDMRFLHGYTLPTFALIYEDEIVLFMKTYEIFGREPALRTVPFTVDSIEPNSKLLIPVPTPYGGVILVGDNIICYHARDQPHISQYIPQTKVSFFVNISLTTLSVLIIYALFKLQSSQVVCYAQVDAKRYLLGDMAGRLYMVHLLPPEEKALSSAAASSSRDMSQSRIGSIHIELLGKSYVRLHFIYFLHVSSLC